MLYDIIQPERIIIEKCIPIFEKLALENERKSSNEPNWWLIIYESYTESNPLALMHENVEKSRLQNVPKISRSAHEG